MALDERPRRVPDDEEAEVDLLIRQGRLEEAEERLRRRLAAGGADEARLLSKWAGLLLRRGKTEAAERLLDRALARDPACAPAWLNRGNLALHRDRLDEAEHCFRKALELRPEYAAAYNNLAVVFKRRGQLDRMVAALKAAARAERAAATAPWWRRWSPAGRLGLRGPQP
ncbi:MAG: tetratricopeptide repeat protein [Clostridia bacterium]|jgi:tetratricopeptide (TPR) repeat protein|nr:tetratricopeptide repeat protein [Clostridia bacterium]MCL6521859.1 tetratricopeptide repeat protein [Bacillota bacterium]